MKKTVILGALSILLIASCSNDDTSVVATEPLPTDSTPTMPSELKLVTSSNTTGKVSYTDLLATSPIVKSVTTGSLDSKEIFYNSATDEILLASRTNNRLETYSGLRNSIISNTYNVMLSTFSAAGDFTNARETAVYGDKIIVTQDQSAANGNTNKLLVYQKNNTGFNLLNSFTTNFKVWGIHMKGNDLYAVADLTNDIVVFNAFMSNPSGSILPSKRVTIQGLIRTHGITYSVSDNVMINRCSKCCFGNGWRFDSNQ